MRNKGNLIFTITLVSLLLVGYIIFSNLISLKQVNSEVKPINNVKIFIEPEDSRSKIIEEIKNAKNTIDLEIYLFSDEQILNTIIDAKKRGVNIRVILEEEPYQGYSSNNNIKNKLSLYGISTKWDNRVYQFTHSKFFIIDKKTAIIMNLNLTKSSFTKNREFAVITTDKETVSEISRVFKADWERKPYKEKNNSLVVSPENSRKKIENLLLSAQSEILIYAEGIDDPSFKQILKQKASSGVLVYCLVADPSIMSINQVLLDELKKSGIKIAYLLSPFIHAKALVIDRKLAYVGSINFTQNSFDNNREVGVIFSQSDAIQKIVKTFFEDYNNSIN